MSRTSWEDFTAENAGETTAENAGEITAENAEIAEKEKKKNVKTNPLFENLSLSFPDLLFLVFSSLRPLRSLR